MSTRLEINFVRLLTKCEEIASNSNDWDWRLEKYVGSLQEKLADLRKGPSRPTAETLAGYTRKVDFLNGLLESQKHTSSIDKALAADLLLISADTINSTSQQVVNSTTRELHMKTRARLQTDMRDQLLGKKSIEETDPSTTGLGVKQRTSAQTSGQTASTEQDIDSLLKHHQEIQEKVASEMVELARNMKETAKAASKVVKEDNKALDDANKIAASNFSKLKTESERLDTHVKNSCNWWIWIMLAVVFIVFINMVLFMRMFPKR